MCPFVTSSQGWGLEKFGEHPGEPPPSVSPALGPCGCLGANGFQSHWEGSRFGPGAQRGHPAEKLQGLQAARRLLGTVELGHGEGELCFKTLRQNGPHTQLPL